MADKNNSVIKGILEMAQSYSEVFKYFLKESDGNVDLATRLTKDMFTAICSNNKKEPEDPFLGPGGGIVS